MAKKKADPKPNEKPEARSAPQPAKKPEPPKAAAPAAPKAATGDDRDARHVARMKEYAAHEERKTRGLVVDEEKKAKALELIAEHAALQAKVAGARKLIGVKGTPEFRAARDAVKAKKKELNLLYAEAPDSVQAAETEFAAQA